MRQLLPRPIDEIDAARCYLDDRREPVGARPWVAVNMAVTADGATALTGRSGGIGGDGDRAVFHALRSAADFVLVGAGTAWAENYGPVRIPEDHHHIRLAQGRPGPARIAVVTANVSLDPSARLFSDPDQVPLIYTVDRAPEDRLDALRAVAEIVRVGAVSVDLRAVLADLAARGARCVVCEGGPSLNGQLLAAGLVDEWCLTTGPLLAGGPSARAARGDEFVAPLPVHLDRLLSDGRDLIARYVVDR